MTLVHELVAQAFKIALEDVSTLLFIKDEQTRGLVLSRPS
jgi:hypothetical protein